MAADLKALKADLQRRMEGAMETLRKEFSGPFPTAVLMSTERAKFSRPTKGASVHRRM